MKRRFSLCLVVVLMVLAGGSAMAAVDWAFGLKAGANFSTLDVDPDFMNPGNRIAFAGGGMAVANFAETWALQLEVLYSPKGSTEEITITDDEGVTTGTTTATLKLEYIEIPLLARFSPGGGPVFLIAGPSFAFKTGGTFTLDGFPEEDHELDWMKDTDLGLTFGVGADANSAIGTVEFDIRYTWGTTNLTDDEGAEFKNQAFLATLGLIF